MSTCWRPLSTQILFEIKVLRKCKFWTDFSIPNATKQPWLVLAFWKEAIFCRASLCFHSENHDYLISSITHLWQTWWTSWCTWRRPWRIAATWGRTDCWKTLPRRWRFLRQQSAKESYFSFQSCKNKSSWNSRKESRSPWPLKIDTQTFNALCCSNGYRKRWHRVNVLFTTIRHSKYIRWCHSHYQKE